MGEDGHTPLWQLPSAQTGVLMCVNQLLARIHSNFLKELHINTLIGGHLLLVHKHPETNADCLNRGLSLAYTTIDGNGLARKEKREQPVPDTLPVVLLILSSPQPVKRKSDVIFI